MIFSKLLRLCLIGGIVIVIGKQLVLSFALDRAFDIGGFLLSIVYTTVMLGIPVYFARINQFEGGILGLSPSHTLGFVLGFYMLYLILFFSRLIMLIDFFARNPFYLVVEFVMMVGVLTALSMPFVIAGKREKKLAEAKKAN